jgi:hypothetical protein
MQTKLTTYPGEVHSTSYRLAMTLGVLAAVVMAQVILLYGVARASGYVVPAVTSLTALAAGLFIQARAFDRDERRPVLWTILLLLLSDIALAILVWQASDSLQLRHRAAA